MRFRNDQRLSLRDQELRELIAAGESASVEFKETIIGSAFERIQQAVCAFANDLPGTERPGIVVVGLADDGSPVSARITDKILRNLSSIRTDGNIVPPRHSMTAVDIVSNDIERRTETYPIPALQQITRNAIMHRSYEGTNAPVRVYWYTDRIEIINPSGPFGQVTADNFGQRGLTDYRNPNLSEAMKVLGFVQSFGAGLIIARQNLKESGHPDLHF